jgi:hypothetical protein
VTKITGKRSHSRSLQQRTRADCAASTHCELLAAFFGTCHAGDDSERACTRPCALLVHLHVAIGGFTSTALFRGLCSFRYFALRREFVHDHRQDSRQGCAGNGWRNPGPDLLAARCNLVQQLAAIAGSREPTG